MNSAFRRHFLHHFSKDPEGQLEEDVYELNEPFSTNEYGCSLTSQKNQVFSSDHLCSLYKEFQKS